MHLEENHIAYIRTAFERLQTKQELLDLLNYAKKHFYGERSIPFELRQLTWYSDPKPGRIRYSQFTIKKRSGGERTIHAPKNGLKAIQRALALIFQCVFEPNKAAMGFTKGRSIVDNAKLHEGSNYIYNIDLKDFFPSIDQPRVWKCFQLRPFNLGTYKPNETHDPRLKLANMLAALCCMELAVERKDIGGNWITVQRNVLPQGAPTSPVLSNVICQKLDYLLSDLAKKNGLKYSRYADDITFSSMHNVYQKESIFLKKLHQIVEGQNFHIKETKTRLQKNTGRQEVTGLIVNEKANVNQQYIKQLRMWLYYWEKHGYTKAFTFFSKRYTADKGVLRKGVPDMKNVISGKLDYLKMVRGSENNTYLTLKQRFNKLIGKEGKDSSITLLSSPLIPRTHHPRAVVRLLKTFSASDDPLKYATHSWDAGRDARKFKDLTDFLSKARNQYKRFSIELINLSWNLNGKIYGFLFNKEIGKTGWGVYNIRFGWSSPELEEACKQNPLLNPEDVVLPIATQLILEGKTIQKFKQVIEIFKNEIEIRDENAVLLNLILKKHTDFLSGFADPEIIDLDNKTFYTDVQWLSKALDRIFDNIRKRPQYREVQYSIIEEGRDAYILEILQKGSFNPGKSIEDEKLRLATGDFGVISDYLRNLCDWSIESLFKEGPYRINYLSSDPKAVAYETIPKAEGFKYRLTFYK